MTLAVGDRVKYTDGYLRRLDEAFLYHPKVTEIRGTVVRVLDTPHLTIPQFVVVKWDTPPHVLPQYGGAELWQESQDLEVVNE